MKQFLLVLLAFFIVVISVAFVKNNKTENEIIRIHIRANSNTQADQDVKFLVKDSVVSYLTPKLEKIDSISAAHSQIEADIKKLENIANKALKDNNLNYNCSASLRKEHFPTRVYDGITFEAGEYTALILELGEADGNNWWCVMYPPLCFINATDDGSLKIKYKSKIMELLEKN